MVDLEELERLAKAATPIPSAPGYSATPAGDILSMQSNWRGYGARVLTPTLNASGYPSVRLLIGGRRKHIAVHRLIAEAFLGHRPSPQHEVRHLNGNRHDNSVTNLLWGTRAENASDRKLHGTERAAANGRASAAKLQGELNYARKLTEHDVRQIRSLAADGVPQRVIAEGYPAVSQTNIRYIIQRKAWRHVV